LDSVTDEKLFERYRAGDQEAFAQLVRRYEVMLYNFLLRFLNASSLAEDVFQETFLQVHLSAETFETGRKFRPWLYAIAANKARDKLRTKKRQSVFQISSLDQQDQGSELWDMLISDEITADVILEKKQTQEDVRDVIQKLPVSLREILLLAYYEQLSYKEIAEILDIPLGTVKSRLHAAVAAFAKTYLHNEKQTEHRHE
jgi:RNA polymerase sigma-70 factor, ECF subfamily